MGDMTVCSKCKKPIFAAAAWIYGDSDKVILCNTCRTNVLTVIRDWIKPKKMTRFQQWVEKNYPEVYQTFKKAAEGAQ